MSIQKINPSSVANVNTGGITRDQIDVWKRTYCKGSTDDELKLFVNTCSRTGLSPEARQIYAVKRWDSSVRREVLQPQTSIDGLRLVAQRTGLYDGPTTTMWTGDGVNWIKCWLDSNYPRAAIAGCFHKHYREPVECVAHWDEYVQTKKNGELNNFWGRMPRLMLAKCAEALALRRAFPQELSGLYTADETGDQPIHVENPTSARSQSVIKKISQAQLGNMWKIVRASHASDNELRDYLKTNHGGTSTKDLTLEQYQDVIKWATNFPSKIEEVIDVPEVVENEVNKETTPELPPAETTTDKELDEKF